MDIRYDVFMTWHKRLTEAREALGLRKGELAKAVGVSNPTVTDWESGEIKKLEADNLLKICAVLKITPEWLLQGKKQNINALTAAEIDLIRLYRQLNSSAQSLVLGVIESMIPSNDTDPPSKDRSAVRIHMGR